MKKLLVVLLALGLIVAFGATASAADVKFGGSYYLAGAYSNNPTYTGSSVNGYSRAYFVQRVRLEPVFAIAEGLTFTARMDALEKKWGDAAWKTGFSDGTSSRPTYQSGLATKAQENFEFERAYVTFTTKAGMFQVGYQSADAWGTTFGDSETVRPRIAYVIPVGPMILSAVYEKIYEADANNAGAATVAKGLVDADGDTYSLSGIFKFKGGEAGLLYKYYVLDMTRPAALGSYATKFSLLSPYAKATFGPVYVEGELNYFFGKAKKYEDVTTSDVDVQTVTAYVMAKMTMGPAYFGGLIGYASGNDMSTATNNDKDKEYSGMGTSWNPALILANDDLITWQGNNAGGGVTGNALGSIDSKKKNMMLYNIFGGFNPTPKINVEAGITMANAVKKPYATAGTASTEYLSDKYGTEIDIKATYKIFDNLSYMVGAGYLWVGDFFKKDRASATVDNDYLLMNKLTLSW